MIPVKYKKSQGPVSVKISINAPNIFWTLIFEQTNSLNDQKFKANSIENGGLNVFPLGADADLIGEIDTWVISLTNQTSSTATYNILIQWYQAGNLIKEDWKMENQSIAPDEVKAHTGDALLIGE